MKEVCVQISVEPREDGTFAVVTRKDGEVWLTHGPFNNLDNANAACSALLKRAEEIKNKYVNT